MALAMSLPAPAPIVIVDYDSRWPQMFEDERERIASELAGLMPLA